MCWCRLAVVGLFVTACGGRSLAPIHLESMITLGADSGDGAIAATPVVSARHPGGFRVVIAAFSSLATAPLVFGDSGRFLGVLRGDSTAAKRFTQPLFTRIGPGDSIWVFDNAARVLLFDPARRYIRTITIAGIEPDVALPLADAVVLGDDRFAATTDAPALLQLFSAEGVLVRSIGTVDSTTAPPRFPRRIARAPDGTLWTTTIYGRWHLDQWDTTGRRLKALEPEAPWLVDPVASQRLWYPRPDQPPPPLIRAIWFDAAGRLWLLGQVADRNWRRGLVAADSGSPESDQHIEPDRYFDTIVEMRDPTTGALLASARFDIACNSIAGPGELVHEVTTSAGWVRAELLRVVLDHGARGAKAP